MRLALTALALGLTTVATAAPALADPPRVHVSFGVQPPIVQAPVPPPVYVAPVAPTPQPPQYGYGYGYGNRYGVNTYRGGGPRWQDPNFFAQRVRNRIGETENELSDHVRSGWVDPRAMGAFFHRRNEIERDLQSASMDGVITFDERQHIMGDVNEMRAIDTRFRVNGARPYGGGPWGDRDRSPGDWR